MSTTAKNEAKRLARELYRKGIIPSLEKQEMAETLIENTLNLYGGVIRMDEEKKARYKA